MLYEVNAMLVRNWQAKAEILMDCTIQMNCQVTKDEGLATMAISSDGTLLLVGGSKGHIRVKRGVGQQGS